MRNVARVALLGLAVAGCFEDSSANTGAGGSSGSEDASSASPDPTATAAQTSDPSVTGATSGPTESTGVGTSATAGPQCSDGQACVPAVPQLWEGPVAFALTDDPAPCPDAFEPLEPLLAFEEPEPAECMCECPPAQGSCLLDVTQHGDNGETCTLGGPQVSVDSSTGGCASATLPSGEMDVPSPPVASGFCPDAMQMGAVPELTFSVATRCAPPAPEQECATGTGDCYDLAGGAFTGVCVHRAGDHPCPPGPFAVRTLAHTGADDSRGCMPCSCDAPGGFTCDGELGIHDGAGCLGAPAYDLSTEGDCVVIPPGLKAPSISLTNVTIDGTCIASGGSPVGGAMRQMPTTICCLAP